MEQKEKIPFYKRVIISIKDFEKYQNFATENITVAIKYILKLMAIFVIIIATSFTYKFSETINNVTEYFKNDLPDLKFEDNILKVESETPIIIENPEEVLGIVIIDTNEISQEKIDEYSKKISLYDNGIVFLKDKLILKNMVTTILNTYSYSDLASNYGIPNFTKQEAINYIDDEINQYTIYTYIFVIIFIYLFILYVLTALINALVLSVLGYLTSRIVGLRLKFVAVYNMSIYALTLSTILNAIYVVVNMLTGFTIEYFNIMYTAISYIYIVTAILLIKSDIIKKQVELMKIIDEQQKVKQELNKNKKEENVDKPVEKENKEDGKDKENGETKEKDEADTNIDTEPQGEA